METPGLPYKSYKFDFWKDRFWMWALVLPIGLIAWALPFVLLIGLSNVSNNNAPAWFPIFGFIFLGIPAYLIGWIFVYSLMEGIYTKVTIAQNRVSIRLPWLIFPILPIVRRIELERIRRVNLLAPYGTRKAVFLYYFEGNKERRFYLPRFEHNPDYMQVMRALKDRIEPPPSLAPLPVNNRTQGTLVPEGQLKAKYYPRLRPHFIDKVLHELTVYSLLAVVGISGWIALSLPASSKVEAFTIGASLAFLFVLLAFCGSLPGLGQIAFWFLGRPLIRAILWLFQLPDVTWDTPPMLNQFLARFHLSPIHATWVEFTFWAVLVISVIISLSSVLSWLRRWAYKRALRSREGTGIEP